MQGFMFEGEWWSKLELEKIFCVILYYSKKYLLQQRPNKAESLLDANVKSFDKHPAMSHHVVQIKTCFNLEAILNVVHQLRRNLEIYSHLKINLFCPF